MRKVLFKTCAVIETDDECVGEAVIERLDIFSRTPFDAGDRVDFALERQEGVNNFHLLPFASPLLELKRDNMPERTRVVGGRVGS